MEDDNDRTTRQKNLKKYVYDTEYFKGLINNDSEFNLYIDKIAVNKNEMEIKHDIELWTKTVVIEAINKTFDLTDLIKYLSLLSCDIRDNGDGARVSEITEWFQQNIITYFLNETRIKKFVQEYFVEDCFRLICDQLALKVK